MYPPRQRVETDRVDTPATTAESAADSADRSAFPDGGYVDVPLSDWGAVEDNLRRFARSGTVDVDDDRITASVGRAHVAVTRTGRVETGMPLHEFTKADVESLRFDHEAGRLEIRDEDGLTYEFRRP